MHEAKYKIGRLATKRTIYQKSNLHSTGGNRQIGRVFAGKYYIKNYKQRQKIRKNMVMELIENKFTASSSKFVTLTFDEEYKTVIRACLTALKAA